MKENILDVLIYLFENCLVEPDSYETDQDALVLELDQAGFEQTIVDKAFAWLENLSVIRENTTEQPDLSARSIRVFSSRELIQLDVRTRGLLLKLEQYGVLDAISREMVISQLMALGDSAIDMEYVTWVVLMVLSNYKDGEQMTELTESLILDDQHTRLH